MDLCVTGARSARANVLLSILARDGRKGRGREGEREMSCLLRRYYRLHLVSSRRFVEIYGIGDIGFSSCPCRDAIESTSTAADGLVACQVFDKSDAAST